MSSVSTSVAEPFDDPTSRTRMAWSRTLMLVALVAALLLRAVLVLDLSWAVGAVVLAVAVVLMGLGLRRLRLLAKHPTQARQHVARRTFWLLAIGTLVFAGLGVLLIGV